MLVGIMHAVLTNQLSNFSALINEFLFFIDMKFCAGPLG